MHNALRDHLHASGHRITHDWTSASPWVKERSHGIGGGETVQQAEAIARAGQLDLEGVRSADVVIVLLGGGSGRGTHAELGAASVLGKPVVLVGTSSTIFGEGGEGSYTCAFYHTGNVARVIAEDLAGDDFSRLFPYVLAVMERIGP